MDSIGAQRYLANAQERAERYAREARRATRPRSKRRYQELAAKWKHRARQLQLAYGEQLKLPLHLPHTASRNMPAK